MIKFFPKQEEAMNAIASELYNFIMYGGAMGGGKTWWGLAALLIMCELFPGSRWCVVREDMEKIRTTTIPSFKTLNPSGRLRESPYEYTHPNGSVILFKSENYENDKEMQWLKGLEVNGFLFEEMNELQEAFFFLAFSRAGRWVCRDHTNPNKIIQQPKPIILGTCNPTKNWVKTKIYDPWEGGLLPKTWLYIPSKVTDNPHLSAEYLENLKNMPNHVYQIMVNGNWNLQMKVGGEFYKCFEVETNIGKVEYDSTLALHISWDDNVNPYLPAGIFQIKTLYKPGTGNREVWGYRAGMIAEIAAKTPLNTVRSACYAIAQKFRNHESGMFIYGDATASKEDTKLEKGFNFYRLILDYLKQFRPQLRVLPSNPSVVMRGQWINNVFEKGLNGGTIQFVIDESCTTATEDFVMLKEAADGTKLKEMFTDAKGVRSQKHGHFTDLTDYFLCSAFAGEFQKYVRGGGVSTPTVGKTHAKHGY